jgi:hypothetical protein
MILFQNRAFYEKMWKNIVELDRAQKTIWRMRIAWWKPKATLFCFSTGTTVQWYVHCLCLILMDPCIVDYSVEITNKMQLCNRIYYFKGFLKAQHVSSGTPLIIRSSKLYLQPVVYMPIWWPAVGNGRSPYSHINQRLQIQFKAPDDERCAARNILSL